MAVYLIAHVGHTGRLDEHICWWKPDSRGYTICTGKAGRYTEDAHGIGVKKGESNGLPT